MQIEAQVRVVKEAVQGSDPVALKSEMDKLGELTRPLADAIMSQAAITALRKVFNEHGAGRD